MDRPHRTARTVASWRRAGAGLVLVVAFVAAPSASGAGAVPATTIAATLSATHVVTLGQATVDGTVVPPTATPRVVLQRFVDGAWADRTAAAVDPATGAFHVVVRPSEHGTYRLRVRSNGGSVTSPELTLRVDPRPTTIVASLSAGTIEVGRSVTVRGTVVEPDALRSVVLQRLVDGRWLDRGTAPVDQATGRFSLVATPSQKATYVLRVRSPGGTRTSTVLTLVATRTPVRTITYTVEGRGVGGAELAAFTTHVAATLADGRGWSMGGSVEFRRVSSGGSLVVALATPAQVVALGPPCSSGYSCRVGRVAAINVDRWRGGAPGWSRSLDEYRHYVVDHEVGHWLGLGHASCPRAGAEAPVMMQQSKATVPCVNRVWPLPSERATVARSLGVPIWS